MAKQLLINAIPNLAAAFFFKNMCKMQEIKIVKSL